MTPTDTKQQVTPAADRAKRLSRLIELDPENVSLILEAFDEAVAARAWDLATNCLERARAVGADRHVWLLRQSSLLLAQGDFQATVDLLVTLLGDHQSPIEFRRAASLNVARAMFHLGEHDKARAVLLEGYDVLDFAEMPAQCLWVRTNHRLGDLPNLVRWGRALQAAGNLRPEVAGLLSLVALDCDDLTLAKEWSKVAEAADDAPISMETLTTLASVALADRNVKAALAWSEKAIERNPGEGRVWSIRAFAHLLAQDAAAAQSDFTRAIQLQPEHLGTWHGLGWLYLSQGDARSAEAVFHRAIEQDRNFAESHGGLAVALAAQGQRDEAVRAVSIARGLDPGCLSAHYADALIAGRLTSREALTAWVREVLGDDVHSQRRLAAGWMQGHGAGPQDM
ncbi:MAG: tetratricopeptide repeat protein [Betaproteobacteria bacterium]|nr:tetratricopeptide repeat protein [Betaproteobacteria bacterium]